jgi:hypothetical protein
MEQTVVFQYGFVASHTCTPCSLFSNMLQSFLLFSLLQQKINIHLASGGGWAARIYPVK